ncbi:MAG: DUF6580 family putative transport protein [Candidatus Kuenenbacteria bacterium]
MPKYKHEILIAIVFILFGLALRILDHPPNFTPIGAIAIFAGTYLSRKTSLIIPILAMFLSDIFIGFYSPAVMAVVYGSFTLSVILGWWLKKNTKWTNILASSILVGVIFYLFTNFAVWVFTPWYPKTLGGLIYCYYLALPFFRNTLMGNLFYATSFFGLYELAKYSIKKFKTQSIKTTSIL